jgi:hypothetical protein
MNAEVTVAKLVAIVEGLAESNEMIINRILSSQVDTETIRETDMETLRETETIRKAPFDSDNSVRVLDLTPTPTAQAIYFGLDFDDQLEGSRAYQRAARNDDNYSISAISSADRTASWSIPTGISLSQISNTAAVHLPIYRNEINNPEDYRFEQPEFMDSIPVTTPSAPPNNPPPDIPGPVRVPVQQHFVRTISSFIPHASYLTGLEERGFPASILLNFNAEEVLLVPWESLGAGQMQPYFVPRSGAGC